MKKIIPILFLSLCLQPTQATCADHWGTSAVVSALVGIASAGGCYYNIRQMNEQDRALNRAGISEQEYQKIMREKDWYRKLAWTFGVLGAAGITCSGICLYKWYMQEKDGVVDTTDNQPDNPGTEINIVLSCKEMGDFLQGIESNSKRDEAAKKIMLLKYSIIAKNRGLNENSFASVEECLKHDAQMKSMGRYSESEIDAHIKTTSLTQEMVDAQSGGTHYRRKRRRIRRSNELRERATNVLNGLDENPDNLSNTLTENNANKFFGTNFNLQEREEMMEIGKTLADEYLRQNIPPPNTEQPVFKKPRRRPKLKKPVLKKTQRKTVTPKKPVPEQKKPSNKKRKKQRRKISRSGLLKIRLGKNNTLHLL